MVKQITVIVFFCLSAFIYSSWAQYINLSGNNPYIQQYVEASPNNWDKPIMYVFYTADGCPQCAQAMGMIYDIYEQNYADDMSLFEIDYATDDEYGFRLSYDLTQPLSIVVVRINDGMSRGYYKIDNPQFWVDNPQYFANNITTQVNNFLNQ